MAKKQKTKLSRKYVLGRAERILKTKSASKTPASKFFTQDVRVLSRQLQRGLYMGRNYMSGDYNYYGQNTSRFARYADYELMDREEPIISSALDQYEANVCQKNDKGEYIEIISDNKDIVEALEELLFDVINIDFNLPTIARGMCKFGDFFALLTLKPGDGVTEFMPLNSNEVERMETWNEYNEWSVYFTWLGNNRKKYKQYEMAHFRIITDSSMLPYGKSSIDSARRPYKQLRMMEDAMLIYKVSRAPETRIFQIDVGNLPPSEVEDYVKNTVAQIKRSPLIDESGQIDMRYNPMSIVEDYVIPSRGDRSSKIETLPGVQGFGMEELEFILNKLFASIKIPKAYLGYDDEIRTRATLTQEDSRFSITIERIQNFLISELNKVAMLHLWLKGFDDEEFVNFDLKMTKPSAAEEAMRIENLGNKMNLLSTAKDLGLLSNKYLQKNILNLTDDEISQIDAELIDQANMQNQLDRIAEQGIRSISSILQSPSEIDKNTVRRLMLSIRPGEEAPEVEGGGFPGGEGGGGMFSSEGGGEEFGGGELGGEEGGEELDLGGGAGETGGGETGGGELDLGGGGEEAPEEGSDAFDRVISPDKVIKRDLRKKPKRSFLESNEIDAESLLDKVFKRVGKMKFGDDESKEKED